MEALARAVAGLLHRGGWFVGLAVFETLVLAAFWWTGGVPFGGAFDRRAAEADFVLLTLTSLPSLVAGALLAAGDREDGMSDFYRSCRVGPGPQWAGSALGLFVVTGGALAVAYLLAVAVVAPSAWGTPAAWAGLALGLGSTLVHGSWGLALGSWVRSRWAAVAASLVFWVVTVFLWEALAQALAQVLGPRWAFGLVLGFTAADPSPLFRVASVVVRGQASAYGPHFATVFQALTSGWGPVALAGLAVCHVLVPGGLAVWGLARRSR